MSTNSEHFTHATSHAATRAVASLLRVARGSVLAVAIAACSDGATSPIEDPSEAATYDLVFEQSAFPLNASVLRIQRQGETAFSPLFGREMFGVEPTASADGRIVVYQGYGSDIGGIDDSDLWLVRANSAPQRVPLPLGETEYAPALSPDGTRLAFVRLGDDGHTELWTCRLDGTERRRISPAENGIVSASSSPDWSPDGQRIAWAFGAPGQLRINIVNADGSNRQVVSAGVSNGADYDVDWSPDGSRLAFVRTPSPVRGDLVIVTLATGQEHAFGLASRTRHPAWAPDGRTIVFASTMDAPDEDYELYTVKPDGAELTRLTFDDLNQRHPMWLRRN